MITSLFQYADFLREKDHKQGKNLDVFMTAYLEKAAIDLTSGFSNLDEAEDYFDGLPNQFFFDGWGNEIHAPALYDAVSFLKREV